MARKVALREFASARSGDKGADANVGVWVRSDEAYRLLVETLTPEVVKEHFAAYCHGEVHRYELPNLRALNFILSDSLDGGGAASLRTDAQGKTLGLGMLALMVDVPDGVDL
jgi:hypothetical protein